MPISTMPRKTTAPVRQESTNTGFSPGATPSGGRRGAALARGRLAILAGIVAMAALVRVWESDWMLERQASRATPAEIRTMAARMPGSAIVRYHLGKALADAKDPAGAIEELTRARQLDPESARVITLLSDQLEREARFSEAGALAEAFARAHPSSAEAHYALGVYYYRVFSRPRAAEVLRRAVQLDPRDARAWRVLGESLLGQDRFGEAAVAFTRAVEIEPDDVQTRIRRGMALTSNHDLPRAEADFRDAVRMDPHSSEPRYWLADFLARNRLEAGAKREAESLYRGLLDDPARSVDSRLSLGRLLATQNRWREAEPLLAAYVAARPRHTEGLYLYAQALRGLRKPSGAVFARFDALKKMEETRRNLLSKLQMQPDNVPLRIRLARLLAANGEPAFAIVCYERALRLAPNEKARRELADLRAGLNGGLALAQ